MAIFPCDWSAHRYPGPQRAVYITSAWGQDAEGAALRLCEKHFAELEELVSARFTCLNGDIAMGSSCDACGKDRVGALFVNFYRPQTEPVCYAADLCAGHWQEYRHLVKVASGRPLTGR